MGGVGMSLGNITPSAEFNIYVDPHAANIVLQSGLPLVMMGLDVTHKVNVNDEIIESNNINTITVDPAVHGMGPRRDTVEAFGMTWSGQQPKLASTLAWQNTCLSPQCSTDLTMLEVRPPKFLHGNKANGTIPRVSFNAGTVAGGAITQPFPHPAQ